MATERFEFDFDPRYRRLLSVLGITPRTAHVTLGDGRLSARFGRWAVETPLDNLSGAELTGPYKAYKVIGPHLSLADRGLTFGTNTTRGACITFRRPVRGMDPIGLLRHPGLTVTVREPERLVQAVVGSAGSD